MRSETNVWAERFLPLLDREALKRAAEYYPEPLTDLGRLELPLAVESIKKRLNSIFYPTEQCLDILEEWVGKAYSHAVLNYTNPIDFCASIASGIPPIPEWVDVSILTGWAGEGKTALLEAFHRAVEGDRSITTPDGTTWPMQSSFHVIFRAIKTENGFWRSLGSPYSATDENVRFVRRMAYRKGISYLALDELQFYTLSAEANTNITRLLMAVGNLGLPTTVVGNFSLLRRLKKRDSPEQQRLLSNVKVMMPDEPESLDWVQHLCCQKNALPEVLAFDAKNDGPWINILCGGQKRAEVRLLTLAYNLKRNNSGRQDVKITLADIETAYRSNEFQIHRKEIEEIARRILMNVTKNDDLSCPIDLPVTQLQRFKQRAEAERNRRVADRELDDSLSEEEKRLLYEVSKTMPVHSTSQTGSVRSIRGKKRPKPSLEELAKNSAMFSESIRE